MTPHQIIIKYRFNDVADLTLRLQKHLRSNDDPRTIYADKVRKWITRSGLIPAEWHPDVLAVGQTLVVPLDPVEFFKPNLDPLSEEQRAQVLLAA